uniref:Uncharacterized protein n=1 Tax=Cyprinus carpio TaxID=7962 RepID=A0A8C1LZH4_CYPCA
MKNLLEDIHLSRSNEEEREAINSLKNGKAPKPDGFVSYFYKKCVHLLTSCLKCTPFEKGTLPQTFYQANIHLFPQKKKKKRNKHQCSAISLINMIAMRVLATGFPGYFD